AQIFLKDNFLLEQTLAAEHIKDRLLGHWGTCPGINLIYAHLNRLILQTDADIALVVGPGHGAAAVYANLFLEGTLGEYFPEYSCDRVGLERWIRPFASPSNLPAQLFPGLPGCLYEGRSPGHALGTAFGMAMDHPDLIVACIIGDGEAETGTAAAA